MQNEREQNYFASVNIGYQLSGIKDEDFISTNYTPLFNFNLGKWIEPYFALQVSYKGYYFNYIGDDSVHYYNFFYLESVVNLNNLIFPKRKNRNWDILLHFGIGYFYNHLYQRSNICSNIGIQNCNNLTESIQLNLDVSSIIGWDIYQGDLDILPGITFGFKCSF